MEASYTILSLVVSVVSCRTPLCGIKNSCPLTESGVCFPEATAPGSQHCYHNTPILLKLPDMACESA